MRLQQVKREIALGTRALFGVIGTVTGMQLPDVVYVMKHRPELFGREAMALTQATLRGASEWTVGERELMASFTAHLQQCEF